MIDTIQIIGDTLNFSSKGILYISKGDNPQTIIQLIPLIISSLALIVSVITFYILYFKKPELSILLADKLKCFSGEGRLASVNTITIFNKGAQHGAVYKITSTLRHKQSNQFTESDWLMFVQDKNVGKEGENFKSHGAFESWAETILIQGRSAVTKKIQFKSTKDFTFQEGDYELSVYAYSGTKKEYSCSASKKIKVKREAVEEWGKVIANWDNVNKISKTSLTFNLRD
jgi:hypothetical protein